MDRASWLRERRAAVEADYDRDAPTYDLDPYPIEVHRTFVDRLVATCPPGGLILDAPCGTGPYFEQVAASGRRVGGADQSAGMAEQARARGIAVRVEHLGLQELAFEAAFDGAMTIDAMEHVPPDDWPAVVAGDTGGYHFYPGRDRALGWLGDAGFEVVAEDADWRDDWGYRHLLLRAGA